MPTPGGSTDGTQAGDYVFRIIAQSLPDRGPNSLERITGADLFMSVSLDGPDGFDKGIFIQSKYDRNVNRGELRDACRRMKQHIGAEGAYVWIYEAGGIKVMSSNQVDRMQGNTFNGIQRRSMTGFTGRILDCYAGSRNWGITTEGNRRQAVNERLREIRVQNAIDISLKKNVGR